MTPLEILPFLLLILAVGIIIGYLVGTNHGIERGYHIGASEEHRNSLAKIMRAKRDGYKLGQIVTLVRTTNGEVLLRGNNIKNRTRISV